MHRLDNVIQGYAWGSREAIARMQGRAPTGAPEAELWLGAHPLAPSKIVSGAGAPVETLDARALRDPEQVLGAEAVRAFGPKLPFLLKVLAAGEPLSLQVHPNLAEAREGFAREDAAGIPRDAGHRNYKDDSHKPELLCALGPFEALCGFRTAADSVALFRALDIPTIAAEVAAFAERPNAEGLRAFFFALMTLSPERRASTFAEAMDRAAAYEGPFLASCAWAVRLGNAYPGDIGAVSSLLLNLLVLQAGEAIYLPAGNLHAYLSGTGVEIMASSDNVLRGGLTKKHVDTTELLRVLDFGNGPVAPVPVRQDGAVFVYETPAREFELSRIESSSGASIHATARGAEILLVTRGVANVAIGAAVESVAGGQALFFDASEGDRVIEGDATLFRATLGSL